MFEIALLKSEEVTIGLEYYVDVFFSKRVEEFETLKVLCATRDFKNARAITHNWIGSCAPYGFGCLGQLAEDLNHALKSEDTFKIKEIFEDIQQYFKLKARTLTSQGGLNSYWK